MSRKRRQTIDVEFLSTSAVTWFSIGLLFIAAVAGLLGQVGPQ